MDKVQEHIEKVREAIEKATPGPWAHTEDAVRVGFDQPCKYICQFYEEDTETGETIEFEKMIENAHLIANSPTWHQTSLDIIEQQQREIDRMRDVIEEALSKLRCEHPIGAESILEEFVLTTEVSTDVQT